MHPAQPYQLLTSTRFDPFLRTLAWNNDQSGPCPFLLLQYHLDRLAAAVEQHGWHAIKNILTYERIKSSCETAVQGCHKGEMPCKVV
jgi:4-amino-4-deoxychorismate lyase